ncbi:MAG: 2,3-bisphosphoglycerate-independent phosphoglycerate mutase, partial [Clostridia bacterium]|nr:2,3-bisphosphoglycerate-independent phosphoglycerate mutase [Clostridia bacterium]
NADEMYEIDKKSGNAKLNSDGTPKAKTSHTLNPVPCYIYDNFYGDNYTFAEGEFGLANVAATVVTMMGYEAPEMWEKSLINLK